MKALVTGHRGFVGTHLCRELQKNGHEVVGLDLQDGQSILTGALPDVDRVFHLAAQTDAQSEDVETDVQSNVLGSIRILARYRDRVVFAGSSMSNYPVCPYAISKKVGEDYARYFGAAVVRFCNLYGLGGHSVIDKFQAADRLTIYGSGEQTRTYAPVSDAVTALLSAVPGQTIILSGVDYTVNEIATKMFPDKPIERRAARRLDLLDARQRPLA